jgi:small GTP-binding protein
MGCGCCSHASTENDILRVTVFGLENSGKTSLVQCLKTSNKISKTSKYISTHGVIAVNVHLNIQTNIHLLIFDCGGCKHQRHIWPHLMNNSDLILFTVDSMDSVCLNDAKQALFDLLNDENLTDKPLLIVFTKSDKWKNKNISQLEQALDLFMIQVNEKRKDNILIIVFIRRIDPFTKFCFHQLH